MPPFFLTPVLVQGAQMPTEAQLPEEIRDFAYRNGFELSHSRWNSDVQEMIKRLDLSKQRDHKETGRKKSWPTIVGVSAIAIALVGGGVFYYRTVVEENSRKAAEAETAAQAERERTAAAQAERERAAEPPQKMKGSAPQVLQKTKDPAAQAERERAATYPALNERLAAARADVLKEGPRRPSKVFAEALRGTTYYTIVIRVGECDPYTVRQAILSVPNAELVVLPAAAEDCYRIGWGLYATESEAHAAQPAIADRLRQLGVNFDGRVQRVVSSLR